MLGLGDFPSALTVSINGNHGIVQKNIENPKKQSKKSIGVCRLYDLALLSQNMLSGGNLTQFIERSVDMIGK